MESFRVLVVDDEELYARTIGRELSRAKFDSDLAFSAKEALRRTETTRYQVIFLDHHLPDEDGIQIIPILLAKQPGASLIMLTAYHTIPNAVQAIRSGADDYLIKETDLSSLIERVKEVFR